MKGALVIGIDHYDFGSLKGCASDAKKIAALLAKNEDNTKNFEVNLCVSQSGSKKLSRSFLKEKIAALFSVEGDIALLYFSGHGTENNLGGYIVTQDAEKYDEGIALRDILTLATKSKSKENIIIIDACNSGHMGNLPETDNTATISYGLSILTACRSDQKAYEASGTGVFSALLIEGLQGWAADLLGKVTIASLFNYAEQALSFFDQKPQFKSHVSRLITIRKCEPTVTLPILRNLPVYFDEQQSAHSLDPKYEDTIEGFDPDKVKIFKELQKLRAASLVYPEGYDHMYEAAINSGKCKLTAQGKYYWYLAKTERI